MAKINRSLAIIIGIDQYTHIPKLKNAVADAKEMARVLQKNYGYEVLLLKNNEATQEKLDELVTNLENKTIHFERQSIQVKPTDRVLFYFAGHGFAEEAHDSEDGKPAGYFMPQDADDGNSNTWLSMPKLYEVFTALDCHHLLMILDCCFAGRISWVGKGRNAVRSRKLYQQSYDRFIKYQTQQIITSAAHDEKAQDSFRFGLRGDHNGHSPFAHLLLKVLQGNYDGGNDKFIEAIVEDKVITVHELFAYLQNQLGKVAEGQTPALSQPRKYDQQTGEYVFLKGEYLFPLHNFNYQDLIPLKLDENTNPYKGLASFEKEDSQLFFGRKMLIEEPKLGLFSKVRTHSLTVVLGTSGSGKSSLVKAGLIPAFKLVEELDQKWVILDSMRPGESPFNALNQILILLGLDFSEFSSLNNQEKIKITLANIERIISPDSKLLLVIDQAEELFTLCQNPEERTDFINLLNQLLTEYQQQLRIVLTLRSEFEAQIRDAIKETHWQKDWQEGRFIVTPMNREELQQAIEEPAAQRALFFESPKLVNDLIDEVVQMPGALPLLSFTLSELYLKYLKAEENLERNDRTITEADYKETGGVTRSLTKTADKTYEKLVNEENVDESTIRDVMLRMVAISGGELARRKVPTSELEYPEPKNEQAKKVIDRFIEARLLVKGLEAENQEYVEPVHDALIIGWAKIKYWLDEKQDIVKQVNGWNPIKNLLTASLGKVSLPLISKENSGKSDRPEAEKQLKVNLPLQREVTTSANNWRSKKDTDENKKAVGFLWDGDPRLPQLEQIQQSENNWFNQTEAQFVEESIVQRRWNIAWIVIWVNLAFLGVLGFTAYVWYQLQLSQLREKAARVENLLETESLDGLVLAIQTTGQNQSTPIVNREMLPEVQSSLVSAVQTARERNRFKQPIEPNLTGQEFGSFAGSVYTVAFSPDSQMIATAGHGGNVYLWDLQGNLKRTLKGNTESIFQVTFSPNGETIIGIPNEANEPGKIQFWNSQGNLIDQPSVRNDLLNQYIDIISAARQSIKQKQSNPDQPEDLTAPDGQTIVHYTERSISIRWTVDENITVSQSLLSQSEPIISVALSPDGKTIVNSNFDQSISLWDVNDGNVIEQSQVTTLADNRDNQLQAFLSAEFQNIPEVDTLSRLSVRSPKGQKIFTGGESMDVGGDKTCLWTLQAGHLDKNHRICQVLPPTVSAAFSPDEKTVAIGLHNGSVSLWDLQNNQISSSLKAHENRVTSIAFSPDGKSIVSGSEDGTVRLSNLQGQSIGRLFKGHKAPIKSVEFRSDGKAVISVSNDRDRRTWSVNWEDWLKVACNRLQYHPVLKMKDPLHEGAKKTCEENVWNLPPNLDRTGKSVQF